MKIAIVGCGGMGALHAQMASNCGLDIAVCADISPHKAEALAGSHGAVAMSDCLAALKQPGVDIVAVTTPTPYHAEYVEAAASVGKHIFCEKPFCRTEAQCRQAVETASKAGVKLFVGHVVRYFHEFEALRAQIASGVLGTPGFAKCYRGGMCPMGEGGWFRDYAQSGGVTFDSSIHDYDWIRYTFGEVERVFCQDIRRDDAINYSLATLRMKSGLLAHVIGTWAHPAGFRVKAEICGDKGMAAYDSAEAPLVTQKRTAPGAPPSMIVPGSPVAVSPYQLEWEDFLAWIRDDRAPRVTADDAIQAVRIAAAAETSARTGEPVMM